MSTININDIIKQVQQAQDAANTANESRYQQLISTIQGLSGNTTALYNQILGNIASMGTTRKTKIANSAAKNKAAAEQDLISRGLGNTTIRNSAIQGINGQTQQALQALADQQTNLQTSALQNEIGSNQTNTGMLANAIQSRNDVGPNLSMYAQLLQQAAAANQMNKKLSASIPASSAALNYGNVGSGTGGASGGGGGNASSPLGGGGGTGSPNGGPVRVTNPNAPKEPSAYTQLLAGQLGSHGPTITKTLKKATPTKKSTFNPWAFDANLPSYGNG